MNLLRKINSILKNKSIIYLSKNESNYYLDEVKLIESYFQNEKLIEFLKNYESLISKYNSQQYFTYFGVNFVNNKVNSVKFYAHLFEEITNDEIEQFVPTAEDFVRFLPQKSKNTELNKSNAGIALELKFTVNFSEPRQGFFYHLNNNKESQSLIEFPKELPPHIRNKCVGLGINYEYENESKIYKKYFYFSDEVCKSYFKSNFGAQLIDNINLMEYAVSDSISKINAYKGEILNIDIEDSIFSSKEFKIIKYFNQKYNLVNMGYGHYLLSYIFD